jgi:ParB family transcriptional regulator, chromosome partitioning protein
VRPAVISEEEISMTTIPLNKLVPAKANVRKTGGKDGIEELAASIAAHGLLTSLVVRKSARGRFTVIAGQRRYHALSMLAGRDQLAADHPVLCQVLDRDADATEIGLAENVMRIAMHPADQFEAFRDLIDKGASVSDIAARFGVSEATVEKRLKLGRVCPIILDAYRAGDIGLEQVQAFALSDDHAAQQRIFAGFNGHAGDPRAIRRALTEGEIPSTDPRLCFIGLAAYEAAGGPVRRDLFDDSTTGYAQDTTLLDRMVTDKLNTLAESVRAEGWSWVETRAQSGYGDRGGFRRISQQEVALPDDEAAELDRLRDEHDALRENAYAEDAEAGSADDTRLDALAQRLEELEDKAYVWTPEQMAQAGVIISLSPDGEPEVHCGLVRPEDAPATVAPWEDAPNEAEGEEAPSPAPSLPSTLVAELTARRTAALRATLAQSPDVALVAVTHALARRAFYRPDSESCLQVTLTARHLRGIDESEGIAAFDDLHAQWATQLPGDAGELWNWCIRQTQDTLLALMAVCAAHAVDAVREKGTREDHPRLSHADALANALGFDMHAWFQPTAANYFGRVKRDFITEALLEAGRPARTRTWAKMKKSDLAALAERELHGTGWLPKPLRSLADMVQPDAEQTDMPVAVAA